MFSTFIIASLVVAQFGILCWFGQRIKSLSNDLMDASYDCQWYTQSKSFKKSLMILRAACLQPIEFCVLNKSFSNETFYEVVFLTQSKSMDVADKFSLIGHDDCIPKFQHLFSCHKFTKERLNFNAESRVMYKTSANMKLCDQQFAGKLSGKCLYRRYLLDLYR